VATSGKPEGAPRRIQINDLPAPAETLTPDQAAGVEGGFAVSTQITLSPVLRGLAGSNTVGGALKIGEI